MATSPLSQSIHAQVRLMYETFPYPHYPLLARPRWQEGYLASSLFLSQLASDVLGYPLSVSRAGNEPKEILLAGSGDMQPFVIRKLEPYHHHITCVDLSASSLRRARIRLLASLQPMTFIADDINHYLRAKKPASLAHCEAYGVLHHLSDPSLTCRLLYECLHPGSSLRVMVYNSAARLWIHQLQKVFRLLGLSPYQKQDLKLARQLLHLSCQYLPSLKNKLGCLSAHTLLSDSRFIDTFFHVRELTVSPRRWLKLFQQAGFKSLGLFDRYAELDDLANPLWQFPTSAELCERTQDGRFENNLELILYKGDAGKGARHLRSTPIPLHLKKSSPPLAWFDFRETKSVSMVQRYFLWQGYLCYVWTHHCPRSTERVLPKLSPPCRQRLARIGAILPGMVSSQILRDELRAPMEKYMQPPEREACIATVTTPLKAFVEEALRQKNRYSRKRHDLILARLDKAQ